MRFEEETAYNSRTAERLKQDRMARGYTQQQVADALEIGLDHYKKLEAGTKNIKLWRLQKLAESNVIKLDIDYIILGKKKDDIKSDKDDLNEQFNSFLREHYARKTELDDILIDYIRRSMDSGKNEK